MDRINADVKSDSATFRTLLNDRKHTTERIIYLNDTKPSRQDTNYYDQQLSYAFKPVRLIIEARQNIKTCFRFKLHCQEYTKEPYFRFDSDGATHRNSDKNLPLPKQIVKTPHFNTFDNNGVELAYRTNELENPTTEAILLNDISLCFAHYCHESNIRFPQEELSEVIPFPMYILPLDTSNEDPLANIDFNGYNKTF